MYEFAKLITETNSKVQESKIYYKAINYINRCQKAIDKELWNLNFHQTWIYTFLLTR